jgi:hypothetical protein
VTQRVISETETGSTIVFDDTPDERARRLAEYFRELVLDYSEGQLETLRQARHAA